MKVEIGIIIIALVLYVLLSFLYYKIAYKRERPYVGILFLVQILFILNITIDTMYMDREIVFGIILNMIILFFPSKIIYIKFYKKSFEEQAIRELERKFLDRIDNKKEYNSLKKNINKIRYFRLFEAGGAPIDAANAYIINPGKYTLEKIKEDEKKIKRDTEENK